MEKFVVEESLSLQRKDALTLSYIGFSRFLGTYGRHSEALVIHRKRLAVGEQLAVVQPDKWEWKYGLADTLFELAKAGEDLGLDIGRLSAKFGQEFVEKVVEIVRV